jgi:methionyl-tRNA formyltransferase
LPKYRGFAPLVNSLINKELRGGVTALYADVNYDEGRIIAQKSVEFVYPLKIEVAIKQIEPLYFDLVNEIYQSIQDGKPILASEQDHSNATYSLWLDQEDYFIDWQWSAEKIKRFVDAVGFPYDGAKARLNEKIIKFEEVEVVEDVYVEHRERHIGKVIFIDMAPIIVCTTGLLKLLKIIDESGQPLNINFRSRFR